MPEPWMLMSAPGSSLATLSQVICRVMHGWLQCFLVVDTLTSSWRTPVQAISRRNPWASAIVAGCIAQIVFRWFLAFGQTFPIMVPDEEGYLLGARLLAGGAIGNLSGQRFYQPGYSLLISPAYWFTSNPAAVYRIVIGINCIMSSLLLVLAYIGLQRMGLSRLHAYIFSNLTALLPSGIYFAQFALADAVLPVIVLSWLLLAHTWLRREHAGYGAAAGATAAYIYCVHSRGIAIVAVQICLTTADFWRRSRSEGFRTAIRGAAPPALTLAVSVGAVWAFNLWVQQKLYPAGSQPTGSDFAHRLESISGLAWTVSLAAGKIWYFIVSTWGVAGIGLVALVVVAADRGRPWADRTVAKAVLASIVLIALATSAAIPDEGTVANYAYGRYLACLAPVAFMTGGAALARIRANHLTRAALAAAGLAVLTASIVQVYAGNRLGRKFFADLDFPEITFLTWHWSSLLLWQATITVIAVLFVTLAVITALRRQTALTVLAAACLVLNMTVAAVTTARISGYWVRVFPPLVSRKYSEVP